MFKIFTFKQLAVISVVVCLIMLLGSLLNTLSPLVSVFAQGKLRVAVIMYHQISENQAIWGDYVIPLEALREDFEYMKKHNMNPISFKQLSAYVSKGDALPQNPVVITFDDGERSFLTKVLPLLEEYSYPANVNIIGSLVELYTQNGDTDDRYAYLNKADVKKLAQHPLVELGCHSYNLHSLSGRRGMGKTYGEGEEAYKSLIIDDLEKFMELFVGITGNKTSIIAYPYGIKNSTLTEIVSQKGFTITLTCREALNTLSVGDSLDELGRFNRPYGKSSQSFFEKIYNT